ncbi:MAG: hypothetical protein FJ206_00650 [Gemmatimonadetes bacterium]|nr:hypothetical protein [Gemmatimonadota bacterium]
MRIRKLLIAVVPVVVVAACADDPTAPVGPTERPSQPLPAGASVDDMDRAIPGFGGFFYDESGTPTVFLAAMADRGLAAQALTNVVRSAGQRIDGMRVLVADYSWRDLTRWRGGLTTAVLGIDGVYWTDADESANRIRVGVRDLASVSRVRSELLRLGSRPAR